MAPSSEPNRPKFFWNISHDSDLYMGPAAIPPPPRAAGQCEAQRAFCSLRLIYFRLGLFWTWRAKHQVVRPQAENAGNVTAPAPARQGVSPSKTRRPEDVTPQLARFFRCTALRSKNKAWLTRAETVAG